MTVVGQRFRLPRRAKLAPNADPRPAGLRGELRGVLASGISNRRLDGPDTFSGCVLLVRFEGPIDLFDIRQNLDDA